MVESKVAFSNPRLTAEFADWPSGRERVRCCFFVDGPGTRGWRAGRRTQDKRGRWCKAKHTTYGGPACIVDGSDGRTCILRHPGEGYRWIDVYDSAFKCAGTVHRDADPEQWAELAALITQATHYGPDDQ